MEKFDENSAPISFQKNWQRIMDGVTQDGHGLWWYGPEAQSRGSGGSTSDSSIYMTNLPCVYPCLCGHHPFPPKAVIPAFVATFDGAKLATAPHRRRQARYLLSGIPRSGSTAVWQVMTLLSGGTTIKSHEFGDVCPLFYMYEKVFCTVRHPFDAYFSALRNFGDTGAMEQPMRELLKFRQLQIFQECMGYRPDMQVHFIKYEDFWDRELEKIKYIASLLQIECSAEEAQVIFINTNVNRNKDRSLFPEAETPNVYAGIRKGHVGTLKGKPGQGAELSPQIKKDLIKNHSWIFEHFNYSTEF